MVTVFTTSGPVTNMYDVLRTMNVKSVMAGEYTAPPAQGPMTTVICETAVFVPHGTRQGQCTGAKLWGRSERACGRVAYLGDDA